MTLDNDFEKKSGQSDTNFENKTKPDDGERRRDFDDEYPIVPPIYDPVADFKKDLELIKETDFSKKRKTDLSTDKRPVKGF